MNFHSKDTNQENIMTREGEESFRQKNVCWLYEKSFIKTKEREIICIFVPRLGSLNQFFFQSTFTA